jgi:hypothetical protein
LNNTANNLVKDSDICEAYGCTSLATISISVKVGLGVVTLFLCEKCVPEFNERETTAPQSENTGATSLSPKRFDAVEKARALATTTRYDIYNADHLRKAQENDRIGVHKDP